MSFKVHLGMLYFVCVLQYYDMFYSLDQKHTD